MIRTTNTLIAGTLILLTTTQSCRTPKETQTVKEEITVVKEETVDHGSAPSTSERIIGTVRVTDDCGAYIEVIQGDVAHSYFPVNLDTRYQIDGMRLKFAFEASATKPPAACPNFEPVSVNEVTPIR